MSECPQLEQCPIWKSFQGPIKTAWINSYCRGPLRERCARMQCLEAGKPISPCLLPNGTLLPATSVAPVPSSAHAEQRV